jgi:DNA polymerase III subunit epsilon
MRHRRLFWSLVGLLLLTGLVPLALALHMAAGPAAETALLVAALLLLFLALLALAFALLDRVLLRPAADLARGLRLVEAAGGTQPPAASSSHLLGDLPEAAAAVAGALVDARGEHAAALARAAAEIQVQKDRLEAILRDLSDGVLACTLDGRILLYNQAAARILEGAPELGLGRSLYGLLAAAPIRHSAELLQERLREEGGADGRDLAGEPFVAASQDGRLLVICRMSLILDPQRACSGFVLALAAASQGFTRLAAREALIQEITVGLRGPLAALHAAAEVLAHHPDLGPDEDAGFKAVIARESALLSQGLERIAPEARALLAADWPVHDLHSTDLVRSANRRLEAEAAPVRLTAIGLPLWLEGDSWGLTLVVARLARHIALTAGVEEIDLEPLLADRHVHLELVWPGAPIPARLLEAWLDEDLGPGAGPLTARSVLLRHDSEPWSMRHARPGHACLRLPLPAPRRPQFGSGQPPLPPRPEFYDFDLLRQTGGDRDLQARPLREIAFVVFDTETTGLDPKGGDEILQLAAVRVVNGRVLSGESFDLLVDPRRPIPEASIRFHGINEAMVAGRPPIELALRRFHAFAGEDVLVAHNAAFDLAFLRAKEELVGLRFDQPVLDTLLLSVMLHPEVENHGLDAVAERLGFAVVGRHTALGDAMVTAQVFVRMIGLLEAQGVASLAEAQALGLRATAVRRRQVEQFGHARAQETRHG